MNLNDARLYFAASEEETLLDQYEEAVFEASKFLLAKVPSKKLYNSRSERMTKIQNAYLFLGGVLPEKKQVYIEIPTFESPVLLEVYNQFHKVVTDIRYQLSSAKRLDQLDELMSVYLNLYKQYAEKWHMNLPDIENVLVSREPDSMEILGAIRDLENSGKRSIQDIVSLSVESVLYQEAKRLSLWLKMEADE